MSSIFDGMNVGIVTRHPFSSMRMAWAVGITALMLSAVPSEGQAQKAMDLPGMTVVAKHHGLSEVALQNEWTEHVREAVMVSQGWVWVQSIKEGVQPVASQPVECEGINELLMAGELMHTESTSFYPCHSGGFVQLVPSAFLDKLEARYLINAKANLNR